MTFAQKNLAIKAFLVGAVILALCVSIPAQTCKQCHEQGLPKVRATVEADWRPTLAATSAATKSFGYFQRSDGFPSEALCKAYLASPTAAVELKATKDAVLAAYPDAEFEDMECVNVGGQGGDTI